MKRLITVLCLIASCILATAQDTLIITKSQLTWRNENFSKSISPIASVNYKRYSGQFIVLGYGGENIGFYEGDVDYISNYGSNYTFFEGDSIEALLLYAMADSINSGGGVPEGVYVKYIDSLTTFVTPTQLADSLQSVSQPITSTIDTIVLSPSGVKIFQNVRSSQLLTGTNAEQRNVFVGWQAGNDFLSGTQGYANTAVGWRSLWQARSNVASEASSNTAVGYNSLDSLTTGSFNTGVGVLAGNAISTAQMNTYVGYHSALYQTGERNVGIGTQVLAFQRGTSSDLVAVGYRSQYYSTTGTGNTSVGTSALAGNQTGSRNTIIGNGSASAIANISDNTAIGFSTQTNTTTTRNTSVGTFSLPANTSNGFNVAVGYDAMKLNASAGQATFVGYAAGDQATSGASFSVGIGDRALRAATGNSNIGIGSLAGSSTTTGASNILIGTNTQTSAVGASNELNIANGIYGVNNYTASTFRLGIGASPVASAKLDVTSTTQGLLPPRMTTAQKNAIASPAAGLMVYDLTLSQMSYYNGSAWINF